MRALARVAMLVTEAPWLLRRDELRELDDDALLHAVALSAYFGHLNRVADAVGVPLDYTVKHVPPHAEPSVPAFAAAPAPVSATPRLAIAQRPATASALATWHAHVFERDDRDRRARIAHRVGELVGLPHEPAPPGDDLDRDLLALADRVTLAPWQVDAATYAPLRARGYDDASLFDAVVVATTANVSARIHVALAALAG